MPDRMLDRCQIDFFFGQENKQWAIGPWFGWIPNTHKNQSQLQLPRIHRSIPIVIRFQCFFRKPRSQRVLSNPVCTHVALAMCILWFIPIPIVAWDQNVHKLQRESLSSSGSGLHQVHHGTSHEMMFISSSCPKRHLGFSPHFLRRLPSERPFWIATG